jgi:hypothetical protein
VISVELARELRDAGLRWSPAPGDRFVVPERDMDEEVFVISDMAVDVHNLPHGQVIGFNGTVEWALDAVEADKALWLPRESQLRELLAGTFRTLDRTDAGWRVQIEVNGASHETEAEDAEQAYGRALLRLLETVSR